MSGHRRTFSRVFKLQLVSRVVEEGHSIRSVARDLEISKSAVGRWVQAYKRDPVHCFPGSGRRKQGDSELVDLRRKVHELEQEVAFLKKAKAFFAKQPK